MKQSEGHGSRLAEEEHKSMERWSQDETRLAFHLMPPIGWLNDPNGLCQMDGVYHVFFQYSPFDARGGVKGWGHYTSEDLINWEYQGIPLWPDREEDRDGVYSGCGFTQEGVMHLYYTGNVKKPGEFDYILDGREANVLHVTSRDGLHVSEKEVVLGWQDYPKGYTRHVRDPKVWKESGSYYMVLGARRTDGKGAALLYRSADGKAWSLCREWTTEQPFGYMWECPDCFVSGGLRVLSISPQGIEREEYRMQNRYQQGYLVMEDWEQEVLSPVFREWDMGFDFYAPQTFEDEKGRRILIGWAGVPDMEPEYDNAPTIEKGWQHALTLPREITNRHGILCQYPVREIDGLRGEQIEAKSQIPIKVKQGIFDLEIGELSDQELKIAIGDLLLSYKHGVFELSFSGDSGRGRKSRKGLVPRLTDIRVLADTTMIEVYLNHGEYVFTTRYYPEGRAREVCICCDSGRIRLWKMNPMSFHAQAGGVYADHIH